MRDMVNHVTAVGDERHQSWVLTSRGEAYWINSHEGKSLPVRSLQLSGLPQAEVQEILIKLKV